MRMEFNILNSETGELHGQFFTRRQTREAARKMNLEFKTNVFIVYTTLHYR